MGTIFMATGEAVDEITMEKLGRLQRMYAFLNDADSIPKHHLISSGALSF